MRVPNFGQPLDERRIVREAKLVAERMLIGFEPPPTSIVAVWRQWLTSAVHFVAGGMPTRRHF